jgi:hypothetical protein
MTAADRGAPQRSGFPLQLDSGSDFFERPGPQPFDRGSYQKFFMSLCLWGQHPKQTGSKAIELRGGLFYTRYKPNVYMNLGIRRLQAKEPLVSLCGVMFLFVKSGPEQERSFRKWQTEIH